MKDTRILIVEDEIKIARFLELELTYEGYMVEQVHDGREGFNKIIQGNFDLVLLDIMLPTMNGIEVLRKLRQSTDVPVIMLTAKDETMDKVMGLDMGADDYITKPFAIEELLARIRVTLKKKGIKTLPAKLLELNDLQLNLEKYTVSYKDIPIELTKREYDLLKYMLENKNIVLTRDKLLETVWGYDYMGDTNVVDVYISYLRTKIDDRFDSKFLYTVRGVGYVIKDE